MANEINAGRVAMKLKGAYSNSIEYSEKDIVSYNGSSYSAKKTTIGNLPTDEEYWQLIAARGLQGVQRNTTDHNGEPFRVKKTYSSIAAMEADFDNMEVGDYVMIATSVEIEDNAKLYVKGEEEWLFISDFSGAQGIQR